MVNLVRQIQGLHAAMPHRGDVLESRFKLHIQSQLAVLAPVNRPGAWPSLDLVLRKGGFKKGTGGIDLNIGTASRAAASKKTHTLDLHIIWGVSYDQTCGDTEVGYKSQKELHDQMSM